MDEMNGTAGTPPRRTRRSEIFLLPNLLSLARILLTPVFVLMMVQHKPCLISFCRPKLLCACLMSIKRRRVKNWRI